MIHAGLAVTTVAASREQGSTNISFHHLAICQCGLRICLGCRFCSAWRCRHAGLSIGRVPCEEYLFPFQTLHRNTVAGAGIQRELCASGMLWDTKHPDDKAVRGTMFLIVWRKSHILLSPSP